METITAQTVTSIVGPKHDKSQQEEEDDVLSEVREALAELFLFWYGKATSKKILNHSFNRKGRVILCTSTTTSTIPEDRSRWTRNKSRELTPSWRNVLEAYWITKPPSTSA